MSDKIEDQLTVEQWLQIRKEEGLRIDPATADVMWKYALTFDHYGVYELSEEYRVIGRVYFARSPESDIWVSFYDLPDDVCVRLWEVLPSKLACPGDFEEIPFL